MADDQHRHVGELLLKGLAGCLVGSADVFGVDDEAGVGVGAGVVEGGFKSLRSVCIFLELISVDLSSLDEAGQLFDIVEILLLGGVVEEVAAVAVFVSVEVKVNGGGVCGADLDPRHVAAFEVGGLVDLLAGLELLLLSVVVLQRVLKQPLEGVVGKWHEGEDHIFADFRARINESQHIVEFILDGFLVLLIEDAPPGKDLPVLPDTIEEDDPAAAVEHPADGLEYLCLVVAHAFSEGEDLGGHSLFGADQIGIVIVEKFGAGQAVKCRVSVMFHFS